MDTPWLQPFSPTSDPWHFRPCRRRQRSQPRRFSVLGRKAGHYQDFMIPSCLAFSGAPWCAPMSDDPFDSEISSGKMRSLWLPRLGRRGDRQRVHAPRAYRVDELSGNSCNFLSTSISSFRTLPRAFTEFPVSWLSSSWLLRSSRTASIAFKALSTLSSPLIAA